MNSPSQLWLLAGGNGAGKTTFYEQFLEKKGLPFINADILARQLDPANAEALSYQAAKMAENLRIKMLESGASFCFETVFSHPSKIDFLARAKTCGYETVLVYIHLQNDELNQARVAQRVTEGGHTVPPEKIITRIPRTMDNIAAALPLADYVQFYDNSSLENPYQPITSIRHGDVTHLHHPQPEWADAILSRVYEKV